MKNALNFLKKIKNNNNTPWMHAHKDEYLTAKKEFEFLVQEIIHRVGIWDKNLPYLEPKQCIFRFARDTRFSDNKKPYKENFGAFLAYGGKKGNLPGYYLHVAPKEVFVAGGIWLPEASDLLNIRRFISSHGEELHKILKAPAFKKNFKGLDTDHLLTRPPKGFDKENPFIDLIKYKSFTVSKNLSLAQVLKPGFGKLVDKEFKQIKVLNEYLYDAVRFEH